MVERGVEDIKILSFHYPIYISWPSRQAVLRFIDIMLIHQCAVQAVPRCGLDDMRTKYLIRITLVNVPV